MENSTDYNNSKCSPKEQDISEHTKFLLSPIIKKSVKIANNDQQLFLPLISPCEVNNLLSPLTKNQVTLLDCRSLSEFNAGHISASIHFVGSALLTRRLKRTGRVGVPILTPRGSNSGGEDVTVIAYGRRDYEPEGGTGTIQDGDAERGALDFLTELASRRLPERSGIAGSNPGAITVFWMKGGYPSFERLYPHMCSASPLRIRPQNLPSPPTSGQKRNMAANFDLKRHKTARPPLTPEVCDSKGEDIGSDPPNKQLTQILPFLFVGSLEDALDASRLEAVGVSNVINVSTTCPVPNHVTEGDTDRFMRIPVTDSYDANLLRWMGPTFDFIEKARNRPGSNNGVLIHCLAGISRSPTLAIAYVMKHLHMTSDQAYRFVKAKRPHISPNFNFLGQLLEYEKLLEHQGLLSDGSTLPSSPLVPPNFPSIIHETDNLSKSTPPIVVESRPACPKRPDALPTLLLSTACSRIKRPYTLNLGQQSAALSQHIPSPPKRPNMGASINSTPPPSSFKYQLTSPSSLLADLTFEDTAKNSSENRPEPQAQAPKLRLDTVIQAQPPLASESRDCSSNALDRAIPHPSQWLVVPKEAPLVCSVSDLNPPPLKTRYEPKQQSRITIGRPKERLRLHLFNTASSSLGMFKSAPVTPSSPADARPPILAASTPGASAKSWIKNYFARRKALWYGKKGGSGAKASLPQQSTSFYVPKDPYDSAFCKNADDAFKSSSSPTVPTKYGALEGRLKEMGLPTVVPSALRAAGMLVRSKKNDYIKVVPPFSSKSKQQRPASTEKLANASPSIPSSSFLPNDVLIRFIDESSCSSTNSAPSPQHLNCQKEFAESASSPALLNTVCSLSVVSDRQEGVSGLGHIGKGVVGTTFKSCSIETLVESS